MEWNLTEAVICEVCGEKTLYERGHFPPLALLCAHQRGGRLNQFVGKMRDGRPFLELRLEPGNLERLKKGDPILKHIEDMFPDGIPRRLDLVISYSETPIADARELEKEAQVALDERTPVSQAKRPHCPECKSTLEQLGAMRNAGAPTVIYCPTCGCVLGAVKE